MTRRVAIYTHASQTEHINGASHPERPQRLAAAQDSIKDLNVICVEAPLADQQMLQLVHSRSYVHRVAEICKQGGGRLDADTSVVEESYEAAARGVGAATHAAQSVLERSIDAAFVLSRPPGHHAPFDPSVAPRWTTLHPTLGFCIFNPTAAAARYATTLGGATNVCVVDVDAHHGNGTQDIFWDDQLVRFYSVHQYPFYPGTGSANETGAHNNVLNVPLAAGSGPEEYEGAWAVIMEKVTNFAPQLIVLSVGFDADARDPLCHMRLGPEFFANATKDLIDTAPVVAILEGGYDLNAISDGCRGVVQALIGSK